MQRATRLILGLLFACLSAAALFAEERPFPAVVNTQAPNQHPPSPQEATEKISLPAGFEVTLFAGEPDVQQPIGFEIDDRGRLWVAECYTYSGRGYDETQQDRIVILEDENHDGQFENRKVFWDQGDRLTSVLPGFGGVWILNQGGLAFLPDENADDVPDGPPQVLLDGFNQNEVGHNIVNGLMWGPDGWIYGRHGIQATSYVGKPGTPNYQRTKLNCSIWRFHPQQHRFEVLTHGTTNPWGFDYNDYGEMFFTNNVIGHLWHVIPGAHYQRMYGEDFNPHLYQLMEQCADHYHWDNSKKWTASREAMGKHDKLGGGHSHCGGMIYLGGNWPEKYRNSIFMCNTHGRRINANVFVREGLGYVGKRAPDLMFANQPWFRGVTLLYGPDGSVFVSDWSDLGECHDHDGIHRTSGRIYKIFYKQPSSVEIPQGGSLADLSDEELVKLQLHPNDWYCRHARRILHERAVAGNDLTKVQQQLNEMLQSHKDVTRRLRALWCLSVTNGTSQEMLLNLLGDENEHLRIWAIRLLGNPPEVSAEVLERFVELAKTERSGLVRLYLTSALQEFPPEQRWPLAEVLAQRGEDATDRDFPLLLWYGVEPSVPTNPEKAIALMEQTKVPQLQRFIARRLTAEIDESLPTVNKLVAWLDSQLAAESSEPEAMLRVITGMSEALHGWQKAPQPEQWSQVQQQLVALNLPELEQKVQELSVVFGDGRAMEHLRELVVDKNQTPEARRNALEVLLQTRAEDYGGLLVNLVRDRATATTAIRGLARYEHPRAPQAILGMMRRLDQEGQQTAIGTLVSRKSYALELIKALEEGRIEPDQISAAHARQLVSLNDSGITEKLTKLWGSVRQTPAEKLALIEEYKQKYEAEGFANANLSRGRLLFKKHCANCHRLHGIGETIGPDLTGSNRDNLDYLLHNIFDPSAVVPEQFRMSTIITINGRVVNGVILSQNPRVTTVQTPQKREVLSTEEIDEIVASKLSLMPDGVLKNLSEEQIRDLLGYLAHKSPLPDGEE